MVMLLTGWVMRMFLAAVLATVPGHTDHIVVVALNDSDGWLWTGIPDGEKLQY